MDKLNAILKKNQINNVFGKRFNEILKVMNEFDYSVKKRENRLNLFIENLCENLDDEKVITETLKSYCLYLEAHEMYSRHWTGWYCGFRPKKDLFS